MSTVYRSPPGGVVAAPNSAIGASGSWVCPRVPPRAFAGPFVSPRAFAGPFVSARAFAGPFVSPRAFGAERVAHSERRPPRRRGHCPKGGGPCVYIMCIQGGTATEDARTRGGSVDPEADLQIDGEIRDCVVVSQWSGLPVCAKRLAIRV